MSNQMIFKRYELKYMMTKKQKALVLMEMAKYMKPDPHGQSTIQSLYFDTPQFILARNSMEKPFYKEKLRLRSYGVANESTEVFLELKKKYDSVVYKRREGMTEQEATNYIASGKSPRDSQIFREIYYTFDEYKGLKPAVLLSYDREAFYGIDDPDFRITFDENILWRDYDVDLKKGIYGTHVIDENLVLMEIKVAVAIPMWLIRLMNELCIEKTSFSKYGTAYQAILARENQLPFAPVTLNNRFAQEVSLCKNLFIHKHPLIDVNQSDESYLEGEYHYA